MSYVRCIASAAVLVAAVAGCGSSGGSVPPFGGGTPTATPVPTTAPIINPLGAASAGGGHGGGQCPRGSAAGGCPSIYALTSDPAGVTVRRTDPSGQTTAFNATLTTPANDPLPDSSTNLQYAFASTAFAAPFVVRVQQVRDGPHQVYYNRAADSLGTVDAGALPASALRRTAPVAVSRSDGEIRRARERGRVSNIVADRVYVRFRADALQRAGRSAEQTLRTLGLGGRELRTTRRDPLTVVAVPATETAEAFARTLRSRSDIEGVYPVHLRRLLARAATVVNDPHAILPDEWYLTVTGFPNAWSYSKGSGATIAVIDTGVDLTNTDLASQVTFSESVVGGQTSGSEVDNDGHGTNIAGVADAVANNGLGFAGAGYGAHLIAIRIFDANGNAAASDDAIAISDALAHGADVINLSLGAEERFNGASGYDEGEAEAIASAIASGATVVAPSGNDRDGLDPGGDGFRHSNLDYPAAYPNVIAVGASKLNDNNSGNYAGSTESVASYSQAGNGLAVVAPGGEAASGTDPDLLHWIWNYYSTTATAPCSYANGTLPRVPTNCTALFNGTSQAAAQVSGAAGLLYAAAGGHHSLSAAQVTQLIENTADNINDPNQGHGRLNVYRAIAALTGDSGATATGPSPVAHSAAQTIAFAYNNSGANRPVILDYDYPAGVPVDPATGTFRIADVRPQDAATFKVGVWYDANANGIIDAGDSIAVSATTCSSAAPCAIGTLRPQLVTGTFALP